MSERIQICCRQCQKILAVPASAEGKQARCPNCSALNLIVRPAAAHPDPPAAPRKARPVEQGRPAANNAAANPRRAAASSSPAASSTSSETSRPRRSAPQASERSEQTKPARPTRARDRRQEAPKEDSRWEDAYDLAPADSGTPRGLPARQVTAQPSDKPDYRATSRAAAAGVPAHVIKEIEDGGRVLQFHYAYSLIYITVWGYSSPHYLRPGQGSLLRSLPYTIFTLLFGWWGIPWGPIYTLKTLYVNMSGGLDVTDEVLHNIAYNAGTQPREY